MRKEKINLSIAFDSKRVPEKLDFRYVFARGIAQAPVSQTRALLIIERSFPVFPGAVVPAAAREETQEKGLRAHVVRIRRLSGVLRRVRLAS